ncbi:MAG: DUF4397 domain-containing protein [Ignavibacteria bacterium]|nr:DUF4397 domain-containing protein [Ignavibacteria bacterium]
MKNASVRDLCQGLLLIAVVGLIASCADTSTNGPDKAPSRLRLMNLVYDGAGLDLKVDGDVISSSTTYGNTGKYFTTTPGKRTISVHNSATGLTRVSSLEELTEGGDFSVYCYGPAAALAVAFQNDPRYTTVDKCRIKLINACTDGGRLELRITGASNTLRGPVSIAQATQYSDVISGSYSLSLTSPDKPDWSIDYESVFLSSAGAFSFAIIGTLSETDSYEFAIRMFNDIGDGNTYTDLKKAASTAQIAFVNALNGASKIDVAVDGSVAQVTNLAFGASTPYITFASGSHTYSVSANATAVISNSTIATQTRKSYSVFSTGSILPSNVAPIVLEDVTIPNAAAALMRIINLVPDIDSLSFFADIPTPYPIPYTQGMKFRSVAISGTSGLSFLSFPATTAPIYVKNSKDSLEVKRSAPLTFEAGKIYTLFVSGTKANSNIDFYLIKHN